MNVVKTSEWLQSTNKAGEKKFWQCEIVSEGKNFYTLNRWYQITKTGRETKRQTSEPYYAAPTNVSRANERNSEEQAHFEFEAIVKKQRDKGYYAAGEKPAEKPAPMLAHKFRDHGHKLKAPYFVQPKLNGMRMTQSDGVGTSRGNKEIIPEVIQHLICEECEWTLDGELILPGNQLLQETMKAAKKYRPGISDQLEYWVYDVIDPENGYDVRRYAVEAEVAMAPSKVKLVPTFVANDELEVMKYHKMFIEQGYEGTMIRDSHTPYEIGKRSYSLLKLKDFIDEEFRIVGIIDGDGSDTGLAIFILALDSGDTFNCRPEGSQENRAELFANRAQLVGQYLTVRFFEYSKDGVPLFPVGVGIRDEEEFK